MGYGLCQAVHPDDVSHVGTGDVEDFEPDPLSVGFGQARRPGTTVRPAIRSRPHHATHDRHSLAVTGHLVGPVVKADAKGAHVGIHGCHGASDDDNRSAPAHQEPRASTTDHDGHEDEDHQPDRRQIESPRPSQPLQIHHVEHNSGRVQDLYSMGSATAFLRLGEERSLG